MRTRLSSADHYNTKKRDIIKFLFDSLTSVALMSVYGVAVVYFVVVRMIEKRAAVYYGDDRKFLPSVLGPESEFDNTTVAPQWPGVGDVYFVEAEATDFNLLENPFVHYMFCFFTIYVLTFLSYFRPWELTTRGKVFTLITVSVFVAYMAFASAWYTAYEEIWGNDGNQESEKANAMWNLSFAMGVPMLFGTFAALCMVSKAKGKKALILKYVGFIIADLFFDRMYAAVVVDNFFAAKGLLTKMFLRVVVHTAFIQANVEICWQFTRTMVKDHGLNSSVGSAIVAAKFANLCFYGRVMCGSADSFTTALLFEFCAIGSELTVAEELLRGRTPLQSAYLIFQEWRILKVGSEVAPETAAEDAESPKARVEKARLRFCTDLIHTISISEAYSLVIVGLFVLLTSANPAAPPGSSAIPTSVVGMNVVTQLSGEIGIAEFLIAYVSSRFPARYCIDLVHELSSSDRHVHWLTLFVIMLVPGYLMGHVSTSLCFTSNLENERDYVLTTCPYSKVIADDADLALYRRVAAKFLNTTYNNSDN